MDNYRRVPGVTEQSGEGITVLVQGRISKAHGIGYPGHRELSRTRRNRGSVALFDRERVAARFRMYYICLFAVSNRLVVLR
jgi:hypothetical protein